MIDWLTARFPCSHSNPIHGDTVMCIDRDGEVSWQVRKRREVAGSHDTRIFVRSLTEDDGRQLIEVDGNPVKYFQGHNLFGTDDVIGLGAEIMLHLVGLLELNPSAEEIDSWWAGDFKIQRVDCTRSYRLKDRSEVLAWIRAAEYSAHLRHRGKGQLTKGSTLYFGKHSRRFSLKYYSKGQELEAKGAHALPMALQCTSLPAYADGQLREELCLRRMELEKLGLRVARNWNDDMPMMLIDEKTEGLKMCESVILPETVLRDLPPRLVAVYELWKQGYDLRAMYPKMTFYRYRNQLLAHDIDIAVRQAHEDRSNVVPLKRVLEAVPDTIPEWAIGTSLYFEPRRKAM